MSLLGGILLFGWLFFVIRAWFDTGDEIARHDATMARLKQRQAQQGLNGLNLPDMAAFNKRYAMEREEAGRRPPRAL